MNEIILLRIYCFVCSVILVVGMCRLWEIHSPTVISVETASRCKPTKYGPYPYATVAEVYKGKKLRFKVALSIDERIEDLTSCPSDITYKIVKNEDGKVDWQKE